MADYIVQAGDTLAKIAKAHGTTVEELAKLNGIKDVNKISVGQKLIFEAPATAAAESTSVERTMTNEEMEARLKQQQEEINRLKNRTLTEQAGEEIDQWCDEQIEELSQKWNATKEEVREFVQGEKEKLIKAYKKGKKEYEAAKHALINKYEQAKRAVAEGIEDAGKYVKEKVQDAKDAHNKRVDAAEGAARGVAAAGKSAAKKTRDALKADVSEKKKSNAKDTSKMTQEELIAYHEELIKQMQSESITDRVKRELKEEIEDVKRTLKTKYNRTIDKVYEGGSSLYHKIAGGIKKVFSWFRFN